MVRFCKIMVKELKDLFVEKRLHGFKLDEFSVVVIVVVVVIGAMFDFGGRP